MTAKRDYKNECKKSITASLTVLLRQIEATDRQIDAPVYELYWLTEE